MIENEFIRGTKLEVGHLFDGFYKADVARSEAESSGLGLAIAKRIVELHDGDLTASIEDNRIKFNVMIRCYNQSNY